MRLTTLNEVKIIQKYPEDNEPLLDRDTIKVFHGTSDTDFLLAATKFGFTGDTRADRRYSYEMNNNPNGLFVTPDIKTAKKFGKFIIELHVKVKDLKAPIWPSGSFTVAGGYSASFNSEEERGDALKALQSSAMDSFQAVKDSDRPEVAYLLFAGGERQSLFMGSMNGNSIHAIWHSNNGSYERITAKEFINQYDNNDPHNTLIRKAKNKLVKPRDVVTVEEFIELELKKYPHIDREEIIEILLKHPEYIRRDVWSEEQYNAILKGLNSLK